ncbi:ABC transporter substrate-binding protein [Paenibacillus sp. MSJ-34]|uniref:ABC transporter substrate-binding protein n=1 Tax=Paenibacillus sp. MSJ-34 TaxID=2841529 RepID=UPI001C1097D1|nr:ABC transporter substrate-binding protein [Paenibacillus sp. MSJ-34]MBU5444955.1 ABC transporter substrate-binding protein [Paenibacillus sp. MSJ-34]
MKRKSAKWSAIVLICFILLLTAACGGGGANRQGAEQKPEAPANTNETNGGDKAPENVKLRIVWWGSQERHDATLKALELYTSKFPHVTFDPEYSGWDGYFDKLAVQSASKNAPDIIQMDAAFLSDYAKRSLLADLTGIHTDDVDASLLDTGKVDGKLYAMPLGNNAYGMAYNRDFTEKLGIDLPQYGWSWDDYFKYGTEAQAKLEKGKYALLDSTIDWVSYISYQQSKGKGDPITPDGKFNIDKDTFVEFAGKFAELRQTGVVTPAEITVTHKFGDAKGDLAFTENVLIRRAFAAELSSFEGTKPGAFAAVTAPRAEQSGAYLKPSMFWSASANSKHVEEAKKFIDWFINDTEAAEVLGTSRGVPVSNKVLEHLNPKFSDMDKKAIELIQQTSPDAQPFVAAPKGWSNFENEYRKVTEALIFNQINAETAYEQLAKIGKEYEESSNS